MNGAAARLLASATGVVLAGCGAVDYADVGVACVERPESRWGTYCTMVLGRR